MTPRYWMQALLWCISLLGILALSACTKERLLTSGGSIRYDVDTFMFDTVFTDQGSSTRTLKIFNSEKQRLLLSSIRLKNGNASRFYLNVNGTSGQSVQNVDLLAEDSLYVFLGVNIDPSNEDDPFMVSDELITTVNGREFSLPIFAYGQNAIYIVDSVLQTQTWDANKPYVIINNALVATGQTLTIPAGTKVYVHANSRLFVQGSLKIMGTKDRPVVFQGDRLDRLTYVGDHVGLSGEWGGVYFLNTSLGNTIDYAVFTNGGASTRIGDGQTMAATIQLDKDSIRGTEPKLRITNTKIMNSQGYGILAFNSTMYAENLLVAECGSENIALIEGGDYRLYNSTFVSYGWRYLNRNRSRVASFTNFLAIDQVRYIAAPLLVDMNNCIVWGGNPGELLVTSVADAAATVNISNSLLKYEQDDVEAFVNLSNIKNQEDPMFKMPTADFNFNEWDFRIQEDSPAKHSGGTVGFLSMDINGVARNVPPTMGCYEFTPD